MIAMKKYHIDEALQDANLRRHFPPYLFKLTKKEVHQKEVVKIAKSNFHQGLVDIKPFHKPVSKFFVPDSISV